MEGVGSDVLFKALTRPQMVLGVPYGFIIGNVIVVAELVRDLRKQPGHGGQDVALAERP